MSSQPANISCRGLASTRPSQSPSLDGGELAFPWLAGLHLCAAQIGPLAPVFGFLKVYLINLCCVFFPNHTEIIRSDLGVAHLSAYQPLLSASS